MRHDEKLLESFAMQAEKMNEPLKVTEHLKIDEVGQAIGLTSLQSRQLAGDMQEQGWAKCFFNHQPPTLQLTLHGKREIAKVHLPRWRRWADKNPAIVAAIVSGLVSLAVMVAGELIKRWLLPR